MATVSGASPGRDPQSGAMSAETHYDRPGFLNSALQNPNWISRNIFPPTRAIVTGAGRVLSSVLGFESSSSSSSSECGSCTDDTLDNNDDQEVSSQGVHAIEDRDPQYFAGKIESKCLIEQLLTQESFSRQECDKLTDIIKSRVVGSPSICGLGLGGLDEAPERTDVKIHDFCNKAVLEATKLLEEKKSEGHHGTSALDSVIMKHDVEGEVGLPVHLSKSYMQTCPSFIGGNFLYSSKRKRNSLATGLWNIQDEIRKVRSKATEEMLRNLSSSKIDWPSFPVEHKKGPDSIAANDLGPAKEDNSQISRRPVDASTDLAAKSDSQVEDKNCWTVNEVAGVGTPNKFPSGSNMFSEADKEQNHGPIISKEDKAVACRDADASKVVAEEKPELLYEASTEVPKVNQTDAADSVSQHSWSMQYEGSPQDQNTPTSKDISARKSYFTIDHHQQQEEEGDKVSRYNMRDRGRHR
ncbi:hypothetical protein HRI_002909600 [Hibiscus trionum]|uniref:Protein KAKU4 n=1 Tax=Hibiscus trionum TaxID=183268 RepID=A0A9W7M6Z8_HIBTR|nr:hypothetical protein HRI_002909600 [Hibiscus trionum]